MTIKQKLSKDDLNEDYSFSSNAALFKCSFIIILLKITYDVSIIAELGIAVFSRRLPESVS